MRLGGIYISVRARTEQYQRDLANARTLTDRTAVRIQHGINSISFAQVGVAAAAFTATFAAGVALISQKGMEFESTMVRVGAVARANISEFKQLEQAARKMGATTEHSATQAAQALQFEAMAGMNVKEQIEALPGLLNIATAAQMDLGAASDIVTDVLTAFGMKTSQVSQLTDSFINTSIRANTNVQMLGESFKYVAPIAAQMGYSVEETSGYLGVMANAGIKASDAGTDLRQVMLRTAKAAKKLGMGAGASLNDVLKEMYKRQLSANEVTELFGMIASKSAMVLMNNIEVTKKLTEEIKKGAGATQEIADKIRSTTENDWKKFQSTIDDVTLSMFDLFKPELKTLIQDVTETIKKNAAVFELLAKGIKQVLTVSDKFIVFADKLIHYQGVLGPIYDMLSDANKKWIKESIEAKKEADGIFSFVMPKKPIGIVNAENKSYFENQTKKTLEAVDALKKYEQKISNIAAKNAQIASDAETKNIFKTADEAAKNIKRVWRDIDQETMPSAENTLKEYYDLWLKKTKEQKLAEEALTKKMEEENEDRLRAYNQFCENVQNKTADMFYDLFDGQLDSFENFTDSMLDYFKRMLAEMAAQAIAQPIIIPMLQSVVGMVGQGGGLLGSSGSGFNPFSTANNLWGAFSGKTEAMAYKALTSPTAISIGSEIFGTTAWSGTAGAELGWGATAAADVGMGTTGLAGTFAAAVPWLAVGALAIPLIMDLFGGKAHKPHVGFGGTLSFQGGEVSPLDSLEVDEPVAPGKSPWRSGWATTTFRGSGDDQEIARALGDSLNPIIEQYIQGINLSLDSIINDEVKNALGTVEFDFKVETTGYHGTNLEEWIEQVAGELQQEMDSFETTLYENLDDIVYDGDFDEILNKDFIGKISKEGESPFSTFERFLETMSAFEDPVKRFETIMSDTGQTAIETYGNMEILSAGLNHLKAVTKELGKTDYLQGITEQIKFWVKEYETMAKNHASQEELDLLVNTGYEAIGAGITGVNANSIAGLLAQNADVESFIFNLEDQLRDGIANAVTAGFSEALYDAFVSPINRAVGEMITSITEGGEDAGTAILLGTANIQELIGTMKGLMENPDFINLLTIYYDTLDDFKVSTGRTPAYSNIVTGANKPPSSRDTAVNLQKKADDFMDRIEKSIYSLTHSDYENALKSINDTYNESIIKIEELNDATAENIGLIQELKDAQIKELNKQYDEQIKSYFEAFNSIGDIANATAVSIFSALKNYEDLYDRAKETGMEEELFDVAFKEASKPVVDAFSEVVNDIFKDMLTPMEQSFHDVDIWAADMKNSFSQLSDYMESPLENLDYMINTLSDLQKLQLKRDSLQKVGDVQAEMLGLSDEWTTMQIADKYGYTDSPETQKAIVDYFKTASYAEIEQYSSDTGIGIDEIMQDSLTLSNILNKISDEFENLRDSMKDYRESLAISDMSYLNPELKTNIARDRFKELSLLSMSSDTDVAQKAMNELPNAAKTLLDLSQKSNTSMLAYNTDMSLVLSSLKNAENYADDYVDTTDDSLTEAEKQTKKLAELKHLSGMSVAIASMDGVIKDFWKDTEVQNFLKNFNKYFGADNVITALDGTIASLEDVLDTWDIDSSDLVNFKLITDAEKLILDTSTVGISAALKLFIDNPNILSYNPEIVDDLKTILGYAEYTQITSISYDPYSGITSITVDSYAGIEQILVDNYKGPTLIGMEKYDGPLTIGYDPYGDITSISIDAYAGPLTIGYATFNGVESISYDTYNGVTKITYEAFNGVNTIAYSDFNGVETISYDTFNGTKSIAYDKFTGVANITYSPFNGTEEITYATYNGVSSIAYDAYNGVAEITYEAFNGVGTINVPFGGVGDAVVPIEDVVTDVSVNIASSTLLTETTFGAFAKAFLGISSIWGNAGMAADTDTGYYSVIDGLLLVSSQLEKLISGSSYFDTATVSFASYNDNVVNTLKLYDVEEGVTLVKDIMDKVSKVYDDKDFDFAKTLGEGLNPVKSANLVYADMSMLRDYGFASGGYHAGGWRLVGEQGPELEYTGSSKIFSHSDSMNMLTPKVFVADSYSEEIVTELKEMRKENAEMRLDLKVANKQIIKLTTKINNRGEQWDDEGIPDVRAA